MECAETIERESERTVIALSRFHVADEKVKSVKQQDIIKKLSNIRL